jgi:hypothetical protein
LFPAARKSRRIDDGNLKNVFTFLNNIRRKVPMY